tara:strand:- start:57428 stop:57901 length:474 start_codon:yes stop_codon:yes gene_type:complete
MEWVKVSIGAEDGNVPQIPKLSGSGDGLDSDASSSHQRFFSDISHMTEVIDNHERSTKKVLIPGNDSLGGFGSIKSFEERVTAIGSESLGEGLEIPLSKSVREEVLLLEATTESGQLIRLVAPEKFGGRVESFKLPTGTSLNEAFWDGDRLKITFNY